MIENIKEKTVEEERGSEEETKDERN